MKRLITGATAYPKHWTLLLAGYALRAGWRHLRRLDVSFSLACAPWLTLAVIGVLAEAGYMYGQQGMLSRVAYQLHIVGVSAFLLTAVQMRNHRWRAVLLAQTVLGLTMVLWPTEQNPSNPAYAWFWFNGLVTGTVALAVARSAWTCGHAIRWMTLLVAISGMGIMFVDLRAMDGELLRLSPTHFFYLVTLFVLWLALTRGAGTPAHAPESPRSPPALARQRMAQELHDGVGSQLTSLISTLDTNTPRERATIASLQHCLMELKLLVDGVDEDASVVELLASLRYRSRPWLEKSGITMDWQLTDAEWLEQMGGAPARDVLRVAQECLTNVLTHAEASAVRFVVCRSAVEDALMLEITDNGKGLASDDVEAHPPRGKGLPGMAWRAERIGGRLTVESAPGQGTCVRLLVPMDAWRRPEQDRVASRDGLTSPADRQGDWSRCGKLTGFF